MQAVAAQSSGFHLAICADKESAAYFYNDLENLLHDREKDLHKKQVLFFIPLPTKDLMSLKKPTTITSCHAPKSESGFG